MDSVPFPHLEAASKIALALSVGLFVGLEREWAQKEVGVRTFSIVALFGTLIALMAPQLMPAALIGMFLLVGLMNVQSLMREALLEMTTSASMLVTLILGGLIGQGHYFTAVTSAILMTMLLAVLTSMASVFVDLPIVYRQIKEKSVSRRLAIASSMVIALGLSTMAFGQYYGQTIHDLGTLAWHSIEQAAVTPGSRSPNR
jgi:uncharacterized membrane protein YhiD involved in acid resistance